MKLSATQEKVYKEILKPINIARSFDSFEKYYDEYDKSNGSNFERKLSAEQLKTNYPEIYSRRKKSWEEKRNGILVTGCINSKTLCKLVEFGLIEIIEDGKNNAAGIDVIQVLKD